MEPASAGVIVETFLPKVAYDAAKRGVTELTDAGVDETVAEAATAVAADYAQFDSEHLVEALDPAPVGDRRVAVDDSGEPLGATAVKSAFRETAAADYVAAETDTTPEAVVERFLAELQTRLADEPVVWRRVTLEAVRRMSTGVDALSEEFTDLRTTLESVQSAVEPTGVAAGERVVDAAATADSQGFRWLTTADFETGHTDTDQCWRRAFTFPEVRAGYPLARERPPSRGRGALPAADTSGDGAGDGDVGEPTGDDADGRASDDESAGDGDRRRLTEEILTAVADGSAGAVVLGAPGSGKTTATRTAVSAWEARTDGGTALYRDRGAGTPLDPEALTAAVETAREDGPVLIAVEDAVRRGTAPVFDLVAAFRDDPAVSFLVNSRRSEWEGGDDRLRAAVGDDSQRGREALSGRRDYLEPVQMPRLDEREVERFLDNYETVTGERPRVVGDTAAIHEQITAQTGISPMLLLAYHVPAGDADVAVGGGDADVAVGGEDDPDGPETALEGHVRRVFELVHGDRASREIETDSDRERALLPRIALAVSVLNAAEADVRAEYLLALGDDEPDREAISRLLDRLRGPLLFGDDDLRLETHHPLWSRLYLSTHLAEGDGKSSVEAFEAVVSDLFALFDDETVREGIRRELRQDTEFLRTVERAPAAEALGLVGDVFSVGEARPELQPLYGTSAYSRIELPSVGGARVVVGAAFSRAKMFNSRGESDWEREEIEWAWEKAKEAGIDDWVIVGWYHTQHGHYASQRGDFETARDHYEQAREEAPDESQHEAASLNNLGVVAQNLGEYEQAREFHEQSLAIAREIGDRAGEATSLNNLGVVAREQENYDAAVKNYSAAAELFTEIGSVRRALMALSNLSKAAEAAGDNAAAVDACEDALELIEQSDLDRLDDRAREFRVRDARLDETPAGTLRLYYHALGHALEDDLDTAVDLLEDTWNRRAVHDPDEDGFSQALAAGVALAALLETHEFDSDTDPATIRSAVERHEARLATPERELYDALRGDDPGTTADDLRETAEAAEPESFVDQVSVLEHRVFAQLLETVAERQALADEDVDTVYEWALGAVTEGDPPAATELFRRAWDRREDHDPRTEPYDRATAAGVAHAACREIRFDDDTAETVLPEIDDDATLSPAVAAVAAHLRGDDPGTTADDLRATVDEDDPSLSDWETGAFARLLELLRDH